MKIANAAVIMQSQHQSSAHAEQREHLRVMGSRERSEPERRQPQGTAAASVVPPTVQLSSAGKVVQSSEANAIEQANEAAANDPILTLIRAMVEWLTGESVTVFNAGQLSGHSAAATADTPTVGAALPSQPAPQGAGFGLEYERHAVYEESEQTSFSASGTIATADGQSIQFDLNLNMARYFRTETTVKLSAGSPIRKDPLVLNFAGTAAQLSSQRFSFDLAGDGKKVEVPLLAGNSGYLALDLNQNGKIDSGAELFGPANGEGFAALAQHDQDGNGWIDENDAVFKQLRIWNPAASGNGKLSTLQSHDVGALYLGHAGTPFELRDQDNQDLGAVRESGLSLTESGHVGSLQEIDLTV